MLWRLGRSEPGEPVDAPERVQPWARPFVTTLLAAFVLCGIFGIEAWPLSGFRLFSAPRSDTWVAWRAFVVTADGKEVPLPLGRLPGGHRAFRFIASDLPSLAPAHREELCREWFRAVGSLGLPVARVEIRRLEGHVQPRLGGRPLSSPQQALVYVCNA